LSPVRSARGERGAKERHASSPGGDCFRNCDPQTILSIDRRGYVSRSQFPRARTDPVWLLIHGVRGGAMMNGQTIVIKGEISGSEDLTIAGRVEGQINLKGRVLTLAPGSFVKGDISAGTVVVSGKVDGSIAASSRLDIRETASIEGTLTAPCLLIVDGAQVNATVEMPVAERRAVA
jgi:cytoskeletal protein CcmA (bactofilin family)